MCISFLNDAKSPTMYGRALCCSQIVYTSICPYYLNTTIVFYFVTEPDVTVLVWGCVQATNNSYFIRTSSGWTLFLKMRFSRSTLDVVLYQVLRLSQQLCWGSVCNVVVYEVLQVSEQVSVFLWSYHQRRYKMFCVCYYQSVLCR